MRDPRDESLFRHREWLGYLQPVGLVVSPPALVESGCYVNTDVAEDFLHFTECTADGRILNLKQRRPVWFVALVSAEHLRKPKALHPHDANQQDDDSSDDMGSLDFHGRVRSGLVIMSFC